MRQDLTVAFIEAMESRARRPLQFALIHFQSGILYIADRDIVIDGQYFQGLVEEWGELNTVGAENAVSNTLQMYISIWNGGTPPFSDNFFDEDPIDVMVEVYQSFEWLPLSDAAILGEFFIQEPVEYSEASFLLRMSLVSSNMRYFAQVGRLLTKQEYPNALEADINKSIYLIIGDAGQVQCLCSSKPPVATLSGSILELPTTIITHEDLDQANFPQAGYLQIDDERMGYSSRDSNSFNVVSRGIDGTNVSDHSDGAEIINSGITGDLVTVEYIVGQGPLDAAAGITDVLVNGQIPTTNYNVFPLDNPARIVFDYQPNFAEYSKGARDLEEDFDGPVEPPDPNYNTAFRPDWAYDSENMSLGAIIDRRPYKRLSVIQTTPPKDDGQLIKVFLQINHWPSKYYQLDQVEVHVDGLGLIGILNKPNKQDIIDVGGEVNLFHHHDHETGGEHIHPKDDPGVNLTDNKHPHTANKIGNSVKLSTTPYDTVQTVTSNPSSGGIVTENRYFNFEVNQSQTPGNTLSESSTLSWGEFTDNGRIDSLYIQMQRWTGGSWTTDESRTVNAPGVSGSIEIPHSVQHDSGSSFGNSRRLRVRATLSVDWRAGFTTTFEAVFSNCIYTFQAITEGVEENSSNITKTDTPGAIYDNTEPVKLISDVDDYFGNAQIEIDLRDNAARSVLQQFDLTSKLETVEWQWINNRKVWLQYVDNGEFASLPADQALSIVVTYINFKVEYRQRQVESTDNITCTVKGSLESRPDAVIQYLLHNVAGLPQENFGSVYKFARIWRDSEIWHDPEIWIDRGQSAITPDGAWFTEAAGWFAARPYYQIKGVISGESTVKNAISNITWQTRSNLLWQHGLAQLVVKRKSDDWTIEKDIPLTEMQLKSLSAKRSEVSRIINKIDLFHTLDRLSTAPGSGQYDATAQQIDQKSIDKHGERVDDSKWLFDLTRNQEMADDVSDYYKWYLGETITYYEFITYLNNFHLEKDDYIAISANSFDSLRSTPVVINEIRRIFGSGKNQTINLLAIMVEAIRVVRIKVTIEDVINLTDDLGLSFKDEEGLGSGCSMDDILEILMESELTDQISIQDELKTLFIGKHSINDSISLGSEYYTDQEVTLNDSITLIDGLGVADRVGFGFGGFGQTPFGAVSDYREGALDVTTLSDELKISIEREMEDILTLGSQLIASDGFGSNRLGDGFNNIPFGG